MEVHGDNMITSSHHEHICNELRRDRRAGFILFVHAGVREARDDGSDPTGGGGFTGGNENEELHEVVVYVATPGLDDEDVFITNRLGDFDVGLAIGKLFNSARYEGHIKAAVV